MLAGSMLPHQQPCCQLLRSLAAALARQAPSSCSSGVQQLSNRLPALLPPVLQTPARFSTASQQARQQLSPCRAAAGWHPQQQQLSLQQPLRTSLQLQQLGRLWQHSQPGSGLLQSRSMATRVEQQAAANPGKAQSRRQIKRRGENVLLCCQACCWPLAGAAHAGTPHTARHP